MQLPQLSLLFHLAQGGAAGKGIFAQVQAALASRQDDSFQAAAILKSVGMYQNIVAEGNLLQHVAVLEGIAADFFQTAEIKASKLSAAAEALIFYCRNTVDCAEFQIFAAFEKPLVQKGQSVNLCRFQGQAVGKGGLSRMAGMEVERMDSGAFFEGSGIDGAG